MSLDGIISIIGASLRFAIPSFGCWLIIRGFIVYRNIQCNQLRKQKILKEFILSVFVFYLLVLYGITVYRYGINFDDFFNLSSRLDNININFLEELIKMLSYGSLWHVFYNVVGNIIWFIPFGFLVPLIWKKARRLGIIIVLSFSTSLSIEILQFIFRTGISDIDDLICNTLGGAIGYIAFKIGQTIYKNIKKDNTHR